MIDAGGAAMRQREMMEDWEKPSVSRPKAVPPESVAVPETTVTFSITETHDGEACECIDQTMTLKVGDELELLHTCHDGRVDKVIARIVSVDLPKAPEHGLVTQRSVT